MNDGLDKALYDAVRKKRSDIPRANAWTNTL